VADPSCLSFSSPDRRLRFSGPPIALGRSLITGGRAIPRPLVARQLRISGESGVCEVATLAGAPPNRESHSFHCRSTRTPSALGTRTPTVLWLPGCRCKPALKRALQGRGWLVRRRAPIKQATNAQCGHRKSEHPASGCRRLRFRIGAEAVRERGRVPKGLGLHLVVLARHRSRDEGVSEPGVHAGSLGSTEPSEAAGTNIVQPRRRMAQESAGCDFSLRSAGDSRQRAFQKRATWPIGASRNNIMDLVSRGVRPAIVLESRAGDKAYLRSRGIEELIEAAVRQLVTSTPPQIQLRGGCCDTRTNATMNSEGNYDPREQVITVPRREHGST